MNRSLRNFFSAAALGLAAVVAAPTASAAIVTGSWDPALPDPPFKNLGWTTTINLQTDCKNVSCTGAQKAFTFLSAQIGFYDLTSGILVEVLTLDPRSFRPEKLVLTPHQITDLRSSTASNAVKGGLVDRGTSAFEFRLGLPGREPVIMYRSLELPESDFITAPGLAIQTGFAVNPDIMINQVLANSLLVVPGRLPEPGSLALALLALGAAGAAASRRKRQGESQAAVTA